MPKRTSIVGCGPLRASEVVVPMNLDLLLAWVSTAVGVPVFAAGVKDYILERRKVHSKRLRNIRADAVRVFDRGMQLTATAQRLRQAIQLGEATEHLQELAWDQRQALIEASEAFSRTIAAGPTPGVCANAVPSPDVLWSTPGTTLFGLDAREPLLRCITCVNLSIWAPRPSPVRHPILYRERLRDLRYIARVGRFPPDRRFWGFALGRQRRVKRRADMLEHVDQLVGPPSDSSLVRDLP